MSKDADWKKFKNRAQTEDLRKLQSNLKKFEGALKEQLESLKELMADIKNDFPEAK